MTEEKTSNPMVSQLGLDPFMAEAKVVSEVLDSNNLPLRRDYQISLVSLLGDPKNLRAFNTGSLTLELRSYAYDKKNGAFEPSFHFHNITKDSIGSSKSCNGALEGNPWPQ